MNRKLLLSLLALIILPALVFVLVSQFVTPVGVLAESAEKSAVVTDPQALLPSRWVMDSLELDGQAVVLPEDKDLTIQFEDGENAMGNGGCNGFSAPYEAGSDGSLTFGPVMSTMMFCENSSEQELAYFQALEKVTSFHLEGGQLILASEDGTTAIVYSPAVEE